MGGRGSCSRWVRRLGLHDGKGVSFRRAWFGVESKEMVSRCRGSTSIVAGAWARVEMGEKNDGGVNHTIKRQRRSSFHLHTTVLQPQRLVRLGLCVRWRCLRRDNAGDQRNNRSNVTEGVHCLQSFRSRGSVVFCT